MTKTASKENEKKPAVKYPTEPTNIKEIDFDYIIDYVKAKGTEDIAWLKDLSQKKVEPNKKGKERDISFIEIRNAFVEKYLPKIMPKAKPKKASMKDRIALL